VKSIVERDDAVFDRQIAVNLKGTFNGMREAARRLRSGGPIVNFNQRCRNEVRITGVCA